MAAVYPLTWEAKASQAHYRGMGLVSDDYATGNHAAPHTWHAAEISLHVLDENVSRPQAAAAKR